MARHRRHREWRRAHGRFENGPSPRSFTVSTADTRPVMFASSASEMSQRSVASSRPLVIPEPLATPAPGSGQPVELPGMVFDAVRNRYFKRPDIGCSLVDPLGVSRAEHPQPPTAAEVQSQTRKRVRVDLLCNAELGRSIPTLSETIVYSILQGGRRFVDCDVWVSCNHGSPAVMLPESVWPSKRSVRLLPADLRRYAIASDVDGGPVGVSCYNINELRVFHKGVILTSRFSCFEPKLLAISTITNFTRKSLTLVGSICLSGHLDLSIMDHENNVKLLHRKVAMFSKSSNYTADVTVLKFGKLEEPGIPQLEERPDIQLGGRNGENGLGNPVYMFPPIVVGFRSGVVSISMGKYWLGEIDGPKFVIFRPANVELGRSAVCDLHLVGCLLYVSCMGNVPHNLAVYDIRRLDRLPIATFYGHKNSYKLLKFDVANGILAAGGDDRCVRLWDARVGGPPIATMQFEDVIDDVRIGTVDKHGNEWVGGLWAKSAHEAFICGFVGKNKKNIV